MAESPRIKVLIVDDHFVVQEGLRTMLGTDEGIEVVGAASTGEEAIQKVKELAPDVVLMDLRMPGIGGVEATKRIKHTHPTTSVIMLTMYDNQEYLIAAIKAGAGGYLLKDCPTEILHHAIRAVASGGVLTPGRMLYQAGVLSASKQKVLGDQTRVRPEDRLNPRELEILYLLAQGGTNRMIGEALSIAEVTVKKHVQSIILKLGATERTGAVVRAIQLGLIDVGRENRGPNALPIMGDRGLPS